MDVPQGLASFPGIDHLISASITLVPGISPSTAQLSIAPQTVLPAESGTFTIWLGGDAVSFLDCKLDRSSFKRDERSELWHVTLLDRRWKWRFGQISGRYNVRRDDGTIQSGGAAGELAIDTERTPRQLAALYLAAMGESDYDLAALPNEARPAVDHDHDNPAQALADLCDGLGCRIVLGLDNAVRIVRAGQGGTLPQAFLLEDSLAVNLPEKPDRIAVVCGPTLHQVDFPLEAVGLDVADAAGGETIRPIDQLSYRPPGGWTTADLPYLHNVRVAAAGTDVTGLRALAVKSVFRYYRIMTPVKIPGYTGGDGGLVVHREQVLPLIEEQARYAVENGRREPLPAAVFGVWYAGLDELENTQDALVPLGDFPPTAGPGESSKSPFFERGFTIDAARGLVIFEEPVYRNSTPQAGKVTLAAAQLVLRAKCQVRDAQSLAVVRYRRVRATDSGLGTETRYLRHDELVVEHVPTYDPPSYANFPAAGADPRVVAGVSNNRDEIDRQCDALIEAALAEYFQPEPRQIKAIGIWPIEIDGAVNQVTYQVGPSGATTAVARSCEPTATTPGYRERRRADAANQAAESSRQSRSPTDLRRVLRDVAQRRRAR